MKNQLITIEEQLVIMGGEDTKSKPKPKPKTASGKNITVGDHNTIVIKVLCW